MFRSSIIRKHWWIGIILSSIAIGFVLVRTMPRPKLTAGLTAPVTMKTAVLDAVPIGSTLAHAEQFMAQEGFECVRMTNADFAEQERVYHQIDYLYCDRIDSAAFPVTRRWQLALVYENDQITDALVSTGLIRP